LVGRQAAGLVRGLNRQLGLWQGQSVKLHTMAQRLVALGRYDPAFIEEARQLFVAVSRELQSFEAMVDAQSQTVAEHSRIIDTRQSFGMVIGRLRACFKLLGMEPPTE